MRHLLGSGVLLSLALTLSACATADVRRADIAKELHNQVRRCYQLPAMAKGSRGADLELRLNPDGSLAEPPRLLSPSANPVVAQAALRAVERCTPFRIPPEFSSRYGAWKLVRIHFRSK